MPKVAVTTTLMYSYAAFDAYQTSSNWQGYVAAAACVVAIVPFTLTAMRDINGKLHKAAAAKTETDKTQVAALVKRWDKFNMTRSALTFMGAVVGFTTLLSSH